VVVVVHVMMIAPTLLREETKTVLGATPRGRRDFSSASFQRGLAWTPNQRHARPPALARSLPIPLR
jgi:hypothetical protein